MYPSPSISAVIKSRIIIWVGHVARVEAKETRTQHFGS